MSLSNEEKINLLNMWINSNKIHIDALRQGIKDYPDADIDGKVPRSQALNDLLNKNVFYESVLNDLHNQA